ncbi:membrane protein [Shewanella hanedai]|jgi:predicted porin|uniref:Porin n=1 Tax=Shewanella hanedai TaxID=25 RepID=A0A553JSX2_SHEHA|nr:porin [Shewanella hanedai]TRY15566.1 porin [Shewanella hanedai]GGI72472.1 membrane protein [Shewanella hanedai]
MKSHFTKTLIGAAISSMFMGGVAIAADDVDAINPASLLENMSYEVYGIVALQAAYRDYDTGTVKGDEDLSGLQLNNETRIGFRGKKQFANFGPTFVWQVEGGYVDPSFGGSGSGFGDRDTFVGFESAELGLIRAGRVLTPLYELVDWPGSNPGMGDVYDWGGGIGGMKNQDRQSDTIRWDTPLYFDALSFDIAAGAGDKAGLGEGKDHWVGFAGHYTLGPIQFDAAYEGNRDVQAEDTLWSNDTYLVGLQGWFDNGISFFAQYKMMEASETNGTEEKQNAMTSGLMYTTGLWQYKLGYAKNFDLERDGQTIDDSADSVLSAQIMYFVDPSAVLYARIRTVDFGKAAEIVNTPVGDAVSYRWKSADFNEFSVGVEYSF